MKLALKCRRYLLNRNNTIPSSKRLKMSIRILGILSSKPLSNTYITYRCRSGVSHAIREAEKVVGYSTSFLNLRWLMTDEVANIALHVRKLIGTNHPLLHTARSLFMGNALQTWGLIVLLISKAAGVSNCKSEVDKDHTAGVLNSQRVLAEVTEMVRMSYMIHKTVINTRNMAFSKDLDFGNKIALLSGDFLLSSSYEALANICNHDVSELFSSALRDLIEYEFIRCKPQKPIRFKRVNILSSFSTEPYNWEIAVGDPRAEWIYRNMLGGASLLAKACQCTLKLGQHPEHIQHLGYIFGKNIALAWQTQLERETFKTVLHDPFSLVSAPIMLHLEQDASLYSLIDVDQVDYDKIRERVKLGESLYKTKLLQDEFCLNALNAIRELPNSDSRVALENIVKTIV